ncbi:hypothetical protein DLM_3883 [Aquitalea magnusonii]|uniref:Uncharacterized protein n=1 Tax=Aquitalea magnusonii TaxID=332411 RepID=A0A3G9GP83_9NEIS|nr:hypothetical protein DLM_3883 [Aquitalea magnusonii]
MGMPARSPAGRTLAMHAWECVSRRAACRSGRAASAWGRAHPAGGIEYAGWRCLLRGDGRWGKSGCSRMALPQRGPPDEVCAQHSGVTAQGVGHGPAVLAGRVYRHRDSGNIFLAHAVSPPFCVIGHGTAASDGSTGLPLGLALRAR